MPYVVKKSKLDELTAALGPNAASYEQNPNTPAVSIADLNEKKREYIKKCEQPKFVSEDMWAAQRPLSIPESIAKAIDERQARGENTEADLNKKTGVYRHRNERFWSKIDLEKMEEADEDKELLAKGKFIDFAR